MHFKQHPQHSSFAYLSDGLKRFLDLFFGVAQIKKLFGFTFRLLPINTLNNTTRKLIEFLT